MQYNSTDAEAPVLTEKHARVGVLTLNRPAQLNALDLPSVRLFYAALNAWANDDSVAAVVVRGAGRPGKAPAFCAGGDIRFQYRAALAQAPDLGEFFNEEYALNHLIHCYPKPYIALMDGIVMGGGMGLSQRASTRIVTEQSILAMPETKIGLFPDVGGGWFLSGCPGRVGEFLAVTGQSISAADAIAVGLADIMVPAAKLASLATAISQAQCTEELDALVGASAAAAGPSSLDSLRAQIDDHFGHATMLEIVASLSSDTRPFASQALASIRQNSPTMMCIALAQVRRARSLTFAEELRAERGMIHHAFRLLPGGSCEPVEGIRALVIDKDRRPRWNPSHLEKVTEEIARGFLADPWAGEDHPLAHLEG